MIILYILFSGLPPFIEDRKCGLNLRSHILQANFTLYPSIFNIISLPSKYLITYLLKICWKERLSVDFGASLAVGSRYGEESGSLDGHSEKD